MTTIVDKTVFLRLGAGGNTFSMPNDLPFQVVAPIVDLSLSDHSVRAFKTYADLRMPNHSDPSHQSSELRIGLLPLVQRALSSCGLDSRLQETLTTPLLPSFAYAQDYRGQMLPQISLDFLNFLKIGVIEYNSQQAQHDFLGRMPATRDGLTVLLTSSDRNSWEQVNAIRSRTEMKDRIVNWQQKDSFLSGTVGDFIRQGAPHVVVGTPESFLDGDVTTWNEHVRAFFVTDVSLLNPRNRLANPRASRLRECLDLKPNPTRKFLLLESSVTCNPLHWPESYEFGGTTWGYLSRNGLVCDGPTVERPYLSWRESAKEFPTSEVDVSRTIDTSVERMRALHEFIQDRKWGEFENAILVFPSQKSVELFRSLHEGYRSSTDVIDSINASKGVVTTEELKTIDPNLVEIVLWGGGRAITTDFFRLMNENRSSPKPVRLVDPVDRVVSKCAESRFLKNTLAVWENERNREYRRMGYRLDHEHSASFHLDRAYDTVIRKTQSPRGGAI